MSSSNTLKRAARSRSRRKGESSRLGLTLRRRGGEVGMRMSALQLGQLVQAVPVALQSLRDTEPKRAGDLFLQTTSGPQADSESQTLLRELLDGLNLSGDLTLAQLRALFSEFSSGACATAVRVIMLECEPRFVPPHVGEAMIDLLPELNKCSTGRDCARLLGPILDELPRMHYYALAELCACLRDTCATPAELACLIGPALLSDVRGSVEEDQSATAAAAVMDLLIEESEHFFGRAAAPSQRPALGERKSKYAGNADAAPDAISREAGRLRLGSARSSSGSSGSGSGGAGFAPTQFRKSLRRSVGRPAAGDAKVDEEASRTAARMAQLVTFYNWRDPLKAGRVHMLFDNHDFLAIARAIHDKYPEAMPAAWRAELADMQRSNKARLSWFNPNGRRAVAAAARANAATGEGEATAAALSGRGSGAPPGRELGSFTAVSAPAAPPRPTIAERSRIDQIIDELIDTEHGYHGMLVETLAYANHIRNIARDRRGPEARLKLGLSAAEVDTIFGSRLRAIVDVSERLLANLEVIDLVRGAPKAAQGRAGLLADAMLSVVDDLHVYAPFVSMHRTSHKLVTDAVARVSKRASGAKRLQKGITGGDAGKYRDSFADIWAQVSANSVSLRGQSIESVLINPVQRVPRYKLLLCELAKRLDPEHPAFEKVDMAANMIQDVAQQLNQAMRQHEKIAALLGEEKLAPSGSGTKRTGSSLNMMKNLYRASTLERRAAKTASGRSLAPDHEYDEDDEEFEHGVHVYGSEDEVGVGP